MVNTGYISFISESGGGQDANFNPLPTTPVATEYVPCNLKTIRKEYIIIVNGESKQAKYSCIIEASLISSLGIDLDSIKKITLQDDHQNDLGEFRVENLEWMDLTKKVKIVV